MRLPINIDDVLHGQTVEWERLEFRQGWNPEAVLHTMCAFANDFHNLGGGHIFIGVAEEDGQPVLPPAGLPPNKLDCIQKEILEIGHRMPLPVFETDRNRTYFLVRLPLHPAFIKEARERKSRAIRQVTGQVTGQVAIQVLRFCEQPRKASEIQALVGVKHRQTFRENYLNALIAQGWLERLIADKPRSRLQRYRTTEEGKKWAQESAAPRPVA
jgi:predicted HTH transcriptional regulator